MSNNTKIFIALGIMAAVLFVAVRGILIPMMIADTGNNSCGDQPPKPEMFASTAEYRSCSTQYVPTPEERALGYYK